MTTTIDPATPTETAGEHVDVLIIGSGISGIGAAVHLGHDHPQRSYAILEMRGATGGTWDLFRYPGIRSDSDLFTFGYRFRPWRSANAIAGAPEILDYLRETAREFRVDEHIRFHHRVIAAAWDTATARWTVTAERTDSGETVTITANWLFCATGYYDYERGFSPRFEGSDEFAGRIVHPQHWPEDLDYAGKRVVVIGSGATAVTLIPAMAPTAAHVTMLQRSPSYVMPLPAQDPLARVLRRWVGDTWAYRATRAKNIRVQRIFYAFCQRFPGAARNLIRRINTRSLPAGFDVDTHFNPAYDPWDQRVCIVPDGDLFRTIAGGRASIVTDTIERFVPEGIRLGSGEIIPADIIVTATGLNIKVFGDIAVTVDGVAMSVHERIAFRGMMLSDVPNLAFAIGYTNASWTLKVDLVCEHLCRMLSYMDAHGHDEVVPRTPPEPMELRPLLDFSSGYVRRALDRMPQQGDRGAWNLPMSYYVDVKQLRDDPVDDPALHFGHSTADRRAPAGALAGSTR